MRMFGLLHCCVALSIISLTLGTPHAGADDAKRTDLENRIKYWRTKLPFCNYNGGAKFPSKYGDKASGPDDESLKCNDGDSVLLNGLTCTAGDNRGCDSVKRSQGSNGRWWRSPKKLQERPADGGSETTFSNDHALGALAYIVHTNDHAAFRNWISWIDKNPRNVLIPRYCQDNRCTFKPIDCPLLDRLAVTLNESNPVCDPLHNASKLIPDLQKQFEIYLRVFIVFREPNYLDHKSNFFTGHSMMH
jgi:hypothetical protein